MDRDLTEREEQIIKQVATSEVRIVKYGTTKRLQPGLVNKRRKHCVPLPAAGWRTQFFHLLFTKPGRSLFVVPCTVGRGGRNAEEEGEGDSEGGRERPEAAMKCPLRRNFGWDSSKSIPNLVLISNHDSDFVSISK